MQGVDGAGPAKRHLRPDPHLGVLKETASDPPASFKVIFETPLTSSTKRQINSTQSAVKVQIVLSNRVFVKVVFEALKRL